jgi:HSP20 family protein
MYSNNLLSLMDDFWGLAGDIDQRYYSGIAVDAFEKDDKYHFIVEAPGVLKEDISVDVNDGILKVIVEKKSKNDKTKYYHREIKTGKYSRSFRIPRDADKENISAHHENGILEIVISKTKEEKTTAITIT